MTNFYKLNFGRQGIKHEVLPRIRSRLTNIMYDKDTNLALIRRLMELNNFDVKVLDRLLDENNFPSEQNRVDELFRLLHNEGPHVIKSCLEELVNLSEFPIFAKKAREIFRDVFEGSVEPNIELPDSFKTREDAKMQLNTALQHLNTVLMCGLEHAPKELQCASVIRLFELDKLAPPPSKLLPNESVNQKHKLATICEQPSSAAPFSDETKSRRNSVDCVVNVDDEDPESVGFLPRGGKQSKRMKSGRWLCRILKYTFVTIMIILCSYFILDKIFGDKNDNFKTTLPMPLTTLNFDTYGTSGKSDEVLTTTHKSIVTADSSSADLDHDTLLLAINQTIKKENNRWTYDFG